MKIVDCNIELVLQTSKIQDELLRKRLTKELSERLLEDWVNYIYNNRHTPLNDIIFKIINMGEYSEMTIDDIDETMMWIKWFFDQHNIDIPK